MPSARAQLATTLYRLADRIHPPPRWPQRRYLAPADAEELRAALRAGRR